MPVRPRAPEENGRNWLWPDGERTGVARTGTDTVAAIRRGSLRFIRELRLLEQDVQRRSTPQQGLLDSAAQLCDDDAEGLATGEDTDMEIDSEVPRPLQSCSILREGSVFRGKQRVSRGNDRNSAEDWEVVVVIHNVDLECGRCCGDMRAENVPQSSSPVVTHWEGEIVDGMNHSFVTCKWSAAYNVDFSHWRKFSAFGSLHKKVLAAKGRCNKLHQYPYIFMRWKELFFVNVREEGCSLTIAGFYYICLSRATGALQGYYYDPNSSPYQKLDLKWDNKPPTFSSYQYS